MSDTHLPTTPRTENTSALLRLLDGRVTGRAASAVAVLRVVLGAFFVFASIPKFPFSSYYEVERAAFVDWGFPDSAVIVILVGVLELGCGAALMLGLGTRLAAAGLAVTMFGAVVTAGVREGGYFHLGLAPALLVALLFLLWSGAGAAAADTRIAARLRRTAR